MKRLLPMLFPTALLAGLLLFFLRWISRMRSPAPPWKPRDGIYRLYRVTRRDRLYAAGLTLLYALVAFTGLGNLKAPQSFMVFPESGSQLVIRLPKGQSLGGILYYAGLGTGKYDVKISYDWMPYEDAGVMVQSYNHLFKWSRFELDDTRPVSAIRLTANGPMELGELYLYNREGEPVSPRTLVYREDAAPLFDETDTAPEDCRPTWRDSAIFDEIYHPRTAYEHIRGIWPYEVSHPPLGKLILSLGIRLFGMTPFGWRFMGTLFGCLMLPILYAFLKRLFGSTPIALGGTVLFATDFMHFVQTRLATIDTYAVFFILLMYAFFYEFLRIGTDCGDEAPRRQGLYLFLSGLSFGLGIACKWTCFYAGGGLALLWLLHWISRGRRMRREGHMRLFLQQLLENILLCLVFFVAVPALIYYLSYTPYGLARGMEAPAMYFRRDYLRLVLDNQSFMFRYHSGVTSTHPYSSRWYQWVLNMRPILYHLDYPAPDTRSSIAAFVNPLLCWGGLLALGGTAWLGIRSRDKKALFLVTGYLAQLLPWLPVSRVVFVYHYFTCVPFLVLCLGYVFDALKERDPSWKKPLWRMVLASCLLFVLFFPVLRGITMKRTYFDLIQWLPSWPI